MSISGTFWMLDKLKIQDMNLNSGRAFLEGIRQRVLEDARGPCLGFAHRYVHMCMSHTHTIKTSWVWWCTPVTPTFGRQRQEA